MVNEFDLTSSPRGLWKLPRRLDSAKKKILHYSNTILLVKYYYSQMNMILFENISFVVIRQLQLLTFSDVYFIMWTMISEF